MAFCMKTGTCGGRSRRQRTSKGWRIHASSVLESDPTTPLPRLLAGGRFAQLDACWNSEYLPIFFYECNLLFSM